MNEEFLNQMVDGAPIFEMKLTNGDTLVAEIIDLDNVDTTFMLYYPLVLLNREGKQYLARWFYSSQDPWIQLEKSKIVAYSECTLDMKSRYAATTLKLDGIDNLVPAQKVSDESYH